MSGKKKDRLDKGAIVQKDRETFAIVPHLPGGICSPEVLRKIADAAEKYTAAAIKATGAQRLAIVGIKEEDLDNIWQDLGMKPAAAVGMCVRSVKFCPGTTFCRLGQQDAVGIGIKLDELYHGCELPSKFKIGVSGCTNCCSESWLKDIGLIGTKKGWKVVAGGNAASRPMIAQVLAEGLTDDEALDLIKRTIERFKKYTKPMRLGKLILEVGIDVLKRELGIETGTAISDKIDTSKINEKAFFNINYGVYVVGSVKDGKSNGQIANTVFQVSDDPPTIAVSINKNNLTHEYIKDSGVFSVSILSEETPMPFIANFGFKSGRDINKFGEIEYKTGITGAPIIMDNVLSFVEAKVVSEISAGFHTIFMGQIQSADVIRQGNPMSYAYYHNVKKGTEPPNAPTHRKEDLTKKTKGDLYRCEVCGYIYDPAEGDPDGGIKPGTDFKDIPDNWECPVCGVKKSNFVKI